TWCPSCSPQACFFTLDFKDMGAHRCSQEAAPEKAAVISLSKTKSAKPSHRLSLALQKLPIKTSSCNDQGARLDSPPMLAKRIIPCLDVRAGRVVKGIKFLQLRDAGDPVEVAGIYDREGADELCFLDITASHENRAIILDVVARTAEQVFMPLTVGGGINKLEDIRNLLNAGADKVSINTGAVNR